jgi:hypothetical protein
MQIQRTANPERRSHLLKKVTTSRTGFSIRFSPIAHINERLIAKSGFHDSLALETCLALLAPVENYFRCPFLVHVGHLSPKRLRSCVRYRFRRCVRARCAAEAF